MRIGKYSPKGVRYRLVYTCASCGLNNIDWFRGCGEEVTPPIKIGVCNSSDKSTIVCFTSSFLNTSTSTAFSGHAIRFTWCADIDLRVWSTCLRKTSFGLSLKFRPRLTTPPWIRAILKVSLSVTGFGMKWAKRTTKAG